MHLLLLLFIFFDDVIFWQSVYVVYTYSFSCNGKNNFHFHVINMSEYLKLRDFNPDLLDIAIVKSYVSSMKQEYIFYCKTPLNILKNLNFIGL